MRVSQVFGLTGKKFEFLDIDHELDSLFFIDPFRISTLNSPLGKKAKLELETFFAKFTGALIQKNDKAALGLLEPIKEVNITHLGYSSKKSQGNSVGSKKAQDLVDAFRNNKKVMKLKIQSLQELPLFIPGIKDDRVSDMATAICRKTLEDFNTQMISLHGLKSAIPADKDRRQVWDASQKKWMPSRKVPLPVYNGKSLLLVPKEFCGVRLAYQSELFWTHITSREELKLRNKNLDPKSRMLKKELRKKYPHSVDKKDHNIEIVNKDKSLLSEFARLCTSRQNEKYNYSDDDWKKLVRKEIGRQKKRRNS